MGLSQKALINKKLYRVVGILFKPRTCIAKTKTVAPGVHVLYQKVTPGSIDMFRQYYLQIADSCLFKIVAPGVSINVVASIARHAYYVTGFMQQGMYGGIASGINRAPYDSCFGVTPETTRYCSAAAFDD